MAPKNTTLRSSIAPGSGTVEKFATSLACVSGEASMAEAAEVVRPQRDRTLDRGIQLRLSQAGRLRH